MMTQGFILPTRVEPSDLNLSHSGKSGEPHLQISSDKDITISGTLAKAEAEFGCEIPEKQRAFLCYYLLSYNKKGSAEKAGYTDGSAAAARILSDAGIKEIKERYWELVAEHNEDLKHEADYMLDSITNADIADYLEDPGDGHIVLKPLEELTHGQRLAIKKIVVNGRSNGAPQVELYDRLQALEMKLKIKGIWVDKHEVDVNATSEVHTYYIPSDDREGE